MKRVISRGLLQRPFSSSNKPRLRAEDFPKFQQGFKPSNIDYNRTQHVKQKKPVVFERKVNKTYERVQQERLRVKELDGISKEAMENGASLALKIGVIVVRQPLILPDLEQWEIDFLKLQQQREVFTHKTYPTDILRMNVKKDLLGDASAASEEEDLPFGVEPWVYKTLSRDTEEIGPYVTFKDLKKRLEAMEATQNASSSSDVSSSGEEIDGTEAQEAISDDGWFEEEKSSNVSTLLDDFDLEVDLADSSRQDEREFTPAPRKTEDDEANNLKSLHRKYAEPLYLVLKTSSGWRFPQFDYSAAAEALEEVDRSNLRVVAEAGMKQMTGEDECELYFVGNAPAGFIKERDPEFKQGDKIYGSSLFFYRAQFMDDIFYSNSFDFSKLVTGDVTDFAWVTRSDLKELLSGEEGEAKYWKYCRDFLEE